MWNATLQESLRLPDEGIAKLGASTEGFSFAHLKELFLSSMMRWIAKPQQGSMEQIMTSQVEVLREQMLSPATQAAEQESEEAQAAAMPPFGRMRAGRVIKFGPGA
jgi:hypothetical protein